MPSTSRPTSSAAERRSWRRRHRCAKNARIPNTSTNVPMISVIRFGTGLRIAGPVQKHRQLEARVLGLLPVVQIREPHQRRADERADELAREVLGHVAPLDRARRSRTRA